MPPYENTKPHLGIHGRWRQTRTWLYATWSLNSKRSCLATRLPPEILLDIFEYLPRHGPKYWSGIDDPATVTWNIALVCRGWHGAATEFLYHSICLTTAKSVHGLCRTLQIQPSLRSLIKVITLPTRGPGRIPSPIVTIFARVINMIDSLERVDSPVDYLPSGTYEGWTGSEEVFPLAPGKHRNISHLAIFGDNYHKGRFDRQVTSFHNLRVLELSAIRLSSPVDPQTTPILNCLERIIISYFNNLPYLDEWLLACPRLRVVDLIRLPAPNPVPKILACGRITHMGISECWQWSKESTRWFRTYTRFKSLDISKDTLLCHLDKFPRPLDTMRIRFRTSEHLPPAQLQQHFEANPGLKNLILRFDEANERMVYLKSDFILVCNQHEVAISFEISSFVERSNVSVYYPQTRWRELRKTLKKPLDRRSEIERIVDTWDHPFK